MFLCLHRQVSIPLPEETRNNGSLYAKPGSESPTSHWRPHLPVTLMSEDFIFSKAGLPSDVRRYMRVSQEGRRMVYLPLLLVNELSCRVKDLMEINSSSVQLPLTLSYEGISLRTFRFWIHLHDIVYSLRQFGFTEENIDEIKETLIGSNLYLLVLTLICEFLALKNDISSWRKKKSMAGMSRKSGKLYLPLFYVSMEYEEERKTVELDTQASRYLSYLVYPLCISGAVFSLDTVTYVFVVSPGVYALGFLSMAPQIFINHKGVNTLISDLCSCASFFSSPVPFTSSHQLSCFRDELLFLLYLYQRRRAGRLGDLLSDNWNLFKVTFSVLLLCILEQFMDIISFKEFILKKVFFTADISVIFPYLYDLL
uniref:Lipid scramblase CLPTM1L n=1 Tax=Cyprinodon variegatus TaxID=28743 RepID=A0A3Q2DD45_CYPVA